MNNSKMVEEYQALLRFHIKAQLGMFIDEIVIFQGSAGKAIFSHHEEEPTWNTFFVDNTAAALEMTTEIATEFAKRQRRPVWYLIDGMTILPLPWRRFSSDYWMVCQKLPEPLPAAPFKLTLVDAQDDVAANTFNRLYTAVFWEEEPDSEFAKPIDGPAKPKHNMQTHHWLAYESQRAIAMASFIVSGDTAAIYNVGTHPALRGRGLASAIMKQVMAAEAGLGVKRFFLITERDHPQLTAFYERLGFTIVAQGGFYC